MKQKVYEKSSLHAEKIEIPKKQIDFNVHRWVEWPVTQCKDGERAAGAQQVQVPVPGAGQHPRPPRQGRLRSRVLGVRASAGPVRQQRGAAVPDLAGRGGEGGAADEGK